MSIVKSFATVLKSDSTVRFKSSKYKTIKKKYTEKVPLELNPITQWNNLLQSVKNQGKCGCCFAMAMAGALGDRLTIMTLAQFSVELSPYQMIICNNAIIPEKEQLSEDYLKQINSQAHTSGACNGSDLYTAMDFLYCIGLTTERCVNIGEFEKYNIKKLEDVNSSDDIPMCQNIIGKEYDTCMDNQTASRFYRIFAGYSVDSDIESIKQEIYKWGPVVSGFEVYDDFLDYDGLSIYTGPKETSQLEGGHAVKIMGWGTDIVNKEKIDYWWICNSWGTNWGLSGYFKMKMGIEKCQLEKNVVAFIPDLVGFDKKYLLYEIKLDPRDVILRSWFDIDQQTGFRRIAIEKIKKGLLKGNIDQPICKYIPDFENMWVGKMSPEDVINIYIKLAQYRRKEDSTSLWTIFWIVLFAFLLGKGVRWFIKRIKKN